MFRLYYFRMYMGIIVLGAFHGLAVLPVLLSLVGLPGAPASSKQGKEGGSNPAGVALEDGLHVQSAIGGPVRKYGDHGLKISAHSIVDRRVHASTSTGGISMPWVRGGTGADEGAMTPASDGGKAGSRSGSGSSDERTLNRGGISMDSPMGTA